MTYLSSATHQLVRFDDFMPQVKANKPLQYSTISWSVVNGYIKVLISGKTRVIAISVNPLVVTVYFMLLKHFLLLQLKTLQLGLPFFTHPPPPINYIKVIKVAYYFISPQKIHEVNKWKMSSRKCPRKIS